MLYFRGCTAREREKGIADATENLLKIANIDYHVLDDEKCCGSVLLRTGFIKEAKKQIEKNIDDFKGEDILTSCAGCYKTLTKDYDNLNVIHISQLLEKLIKDKKITVNKKNLDVTYHDSCHLSRECKEYDAPRNVINSIANLTEMKNNKDNSLCCGAGGGVKSAYPEIASKISNLRINQAKNINVDILITTCPFCKLNLKDSSSLEVLDLTEFLTMYGEIKNEGK